MDDAKLGQQAPLFGEELQTRYMMLLFLYPFGWLTEASLDTALSKVDSKRVTVTELSRAWDPMRMTMDKLQ